MRELLPEDGTVEQPVSEELKEETRRWIEPPVTVEKPVRPGKAPEPPRTTRYDLD